MSELPPNERQAAVDGAITSRRSVRGFLPTPVSEATVREILEVAARAPSGTNTQPWKVHVLMGAARQRLSDAILAAYNDPAERAQHAEEYDYYPREWVSPYIDRRRKIGWDLYGLLEIGKTDKDKMHAQHGRNYVFFDAPVGFIFTIDRILAQGSWLDYGMFFENIMVVARGRGLDTCLQAAFTQFYRVIKRELNLADHEMVICGMALGVADPDAVANRLTTARAAVDEFTQFHS